MEPAALHPLARSNRCFTEQERLALRRGLVKLRLRLPDGLPLWPQGCRAVAMNDALQRRSYLDRDVSCANIEPQQQVEYLVLKRSARTAKLARRSALCLCALGELHAQLRVRTRDELGVVACSLLTQQLLTKLTDNSQSGRMISMADALGVTTSADDACISDGLDSGSSRTAR